MRTMIILIISRLKYGQGSYLYCIYVVPSGVLENFTWIAAGLELYSHVY